MKFYYPFFLIAIIMLIASCKDKAGDTTFNIDVTAEVTLPATHGIELPVDADSEWEETESTSIFESENTEAGLLTSASLKNLQLVLKTPVGGNFNYLDEISVFINAAGLPEIKVANNLDAETGVGILNFEELDVDVLEYVKSNTIQFRVNYSSDDYESEDHDCEIYSVFEVSGTTLN
jgi:hypothetical protein